MYDEHDRLDEDLAHLAQLLRSSDVMMACIQLAELGLKLDRIMRCEERVLSFAYERAAVTAPGPLAMVRKEHATLRRHVSMIADALDRADVRRGLEVIARLRSLLLVHLAKEEVLQPLFDGRS